MCFANSDLHARLSAESKDELRDETRSSPYAIFYDIGYFMVKRFSPKHNVARTLYFTLMVILQYMVCGEARCFPRSLFYDNDYFTVEKDCGDARCFHTNYFTLVVIWR